MIDAIALLMHLSCQQAPCKAIEAEDVYESMIECRKKAFERIQETHEIYACVLAYREKADGPKVIKPFTKD